MSNRNPADLEGRFLKTYSPAQFATLLNTDKQAGTQVQNVLDQHIQDFLQEVLDAEGKTADSVVVRLDERDAEAFLIAAPGGKGLHRSLYRQSRFFNEVTAVIITRFRGQVHILLQREAPVVRTTSTKKVASLDPFKKYVFIHVLRFVRKRWEELAKGDQEVERVAEFQEVVSAKLDALQGGEDEQEG
jgi:hypothetical protein